MTVFVFSGPYFDVCYDVTLKHLEEGDPHDTVLHMCGDKKKQEEPGADF